MISHWMETGLRIDAAGQPIPRRIINRMVCDRDGEPIFAADLTPAIAANAYLSFPMVARESAVLDFVWREDGGAEYHASHCLDGDLTGGRGLRASDERGRACLERARRHRSDRAVAAPTRHAWPCSACCSRWRPWAVARPCRSAGRSSWSTSTVPPAPTPTSAAPTC